MSTGEHRARIHQSVSRYYTAKLHEHGAVPKGVDWADQQSQHIRFAQLARCMPDTDFELYDVGCGYGAPAYASAAGTVIVAGWMGGYGNLVVIDHGGGVSTAYGHNSSISVSVGQSVSQGQVIAAIGSTGHSTGPHCHFEVRVNGSPVDPLSYL